MSDKDDGGTAFPVGSLACGSIGMSLRDYFAGQALVGLAASIQGPGCESWDYYANGAYAIADAMLKVRNGKT